jgi:hypothetical protein
VVATAHENMSMEILRFDRDERVIGAHASIGLHATRIASGDGAVALTCLALQPGGTTAERHCPIKSSWSSASRSRAAREPEPAFWTTRALACDGQPDPPNGGHPSCPVAVKAITWCDSSPC